MQPSIPETMLAIGLNDDGQLVTKTIQVPRPGKGEVLVKISAAPVNPSDLARIRHLDPRERPRFIAGIEGCGKVVARGKGLLPALWMGRRVACSASHAHSGSWAEYMVTSAMECLPLPAALPDEQGSMMLVNPLTALAFFKIIHQGNHQAIINTAAASALGRIIELLGKQQGVPVIHVVRSESQVSVLTLRGAQYVLNSNSTGFRDDLHRLAVHLKATLAFDAVGGSLTRDLLMAIPFGGTVMVYGNLSGAHPETDHRSLVVDNKTIHGFYLVNWLRHQNLITVLRSILHARRLLKNEITIPVQAKYPLDHIQEAVDEYLGNMTAGKVLIIP
jgi:NADPH:quinone reductase-like Zn-dependent oxidoreductase